MNCKRLSVVISIILIVTAFSSCGDIMAGQKVITKKYYLSEDETYGLTIYRKTDEGDLIGRIPPKVIEYGFNDSFLVGKCETNHSIQYYIINMVKDSDYAEDSVFVVDTAISEADYFSKWNDRLKISFKKAK